VVAVELEEEELALLVKRTPPSTEAHSNMDPGLRDRWIEALESKKYKRCKNRLRDGDAYCPLGVLCDLVDPKGWKREGPMHFRGEGWFHQKRRGKPSADILRTIGLSSWACGKLEDVNWLRVSPPNSFARSIEWIRNNL